MSEKQTRIGKMTNTRSINVYLARTLVFITFLVSSSIPLLAQGAKSMTPKQECETLMNELLPVAEKMLEKYGEFFPYGSVMNSDGSIRAVAYYDGNEHPKSQDLMDQLTTIYHEYSIKNQIKASGIVYDARVISPKTNAKTDAVIISLEHRDNYSVQVVFPYSIKNKKVVWDDIFAQRGKVDVFK
jgi:hypothetical protein